MAKKVKFPLIIEPGNKAVRTLEELREHFDLASVLGYYENGRLADWLSVWYYDEAEKVKSLDAKSSDFKNRLCDILGVPFPDEIADNVSMTYVAQKNKRLEQLKKITADDKILAAVDNVAFTQEELEGLISLRLHHVYTTNKRFKVIIYLCGERFAIPYSAITASGNLKFIGLNMPVVTLIKDDDYLVDMLYSPHIVFENVEFDIDSVMSLVDETPVQSGSIKWLMLAANAGDIRAQFNLACKYCNGDGVEVDFKKSFVWYSKAAEQGDPDARYHMGLLYWYGKGLEEDKKEAIKFYRKAAEQGHKRSIAKLVEAGIKFERLNLIDTNETSKWALKLVEQGDMSVTNCDVIGFLDNRGYDIKLSFLDLFGTILYGAGGMDNLSYKSHRDGSMHPRVQIFLDGYASTHGNVKFYVNRKSMVKREILKKIASRVTIDTEGKGNSGGEVKIWLPNFDKDTKEDLEKKFSMLIGR